MLPILSHEAESIVRHVDREHRHDDCRELHGAAFGGLCENKDTMKRIGWNENISLRPISDLRFQIDLAGWYSCFKDN